LKKSISLKVIQLDGRCGQGDEKTRGGKMKDSQAMLLKTNGSKMSETGLFAMLMKINKLKFVSRDSDENTGSY
jgi:hypothetical protein